MGNLALKGQKRRILFMLLPFQGVGGGRLLPWAMPWAGSSLPLRGALTRFTIAPSCFLTVTKSYLTIIPNDNTMMLFNDLILPIFEKVECLQKDSLRLATLRDTLLPKLMSGQIKVNEIEKSL